MSDAQPLLNEKDLLIAVLDLPEAERDRFLDVACAGNSELRSRVLQLLRNTDGSDGFMTGPIIDLETTTGIKDVSSGAQIGRYRLMEQIGEGGMGVVFVAEQIEPVRRKVALKVIKPGMDSKAVIARFEAERQALALMDHPHIARVFDAGSTPDRLPFFVMELVRGLPITKYCDKARSTMNERLKLFIDVCSAVQHAHQKGIIHRDLKPSNILVTLHDGKPIVKVIDFGVAKALHQQLTPNTLYTALNQVIGTPLYMSPEQLELSGLDIDTRSDIYSLGVLLYELITGTAPFDRERLLKSGFDELRRIIREEDPPRPSYRVTTLPQATLSTFGKERGLDQRDFVRSIRTELDWITLKALAKDRQHRYTSALDLADDVRRFLDNEPVRACPPSWRYTTSKLARRHRGALTTAVLLLAAMIIGTAASVGFAIRASNAEQESLQRLGQVSRAEAKTREALVAVQESAQRQRELRQKAEADALAARESAIKQAELREEAESAHRQSQWNLYVANLATMQSALREQRYGHLERLLTQTIPAEGETDYRGWEWYYMQQKVQLVSKTLPPEHPEYWRRDVTFHPKRNEFAKFKSPNFIDVWDASSLTRLKRFDCRCRDPVWTLAWSPRGNRIAIGTTGSSELIVLDSSDGKIVWRSQPLPLRDNQSDEARIASVSWHPDNERIAVGSRYGDIAIVDLKESSSTRIHSQPEEGYLGSLAWHPDGKLLAAGMRYGKRRLFDIEDETAIDLVMHNVEIGYNVAWNPSGALLATTEGAAIRVADSQGNDRFLLTGHAARINDLAWLNDRYLLSASNDHTIRVWDAENRTQVKLLSLFDEPIDGIAIAAAREQKFAGARNPVDPATPVSDPASAARVNEKRADFDVHIVASSQTRVKLINLAAGGLPQQATIPDGTGNFAAVHNLNNGITELHWSRDGTEIFAVTELSNGPIFGGMTALFSSVSMRPLGFANTTHPCKGAILDEDSMSSLWASGDDQLKVSDPRTGTIWQSLPCELFGDSIAVWSPSSQMVMTHHGRLPPNLKATATGKLIAEWPQTIRRPLHTGAWDPTETRFIAGGHANPGLFTTTGFYTEFPDTQSINSFGVDWHPGGRVVALGNQRGVIQIRDAHSLAVIEVMRGHLGGITGLEFSPDGRRLASASEDGTVRIWDVATGRELFAMTAEDVEGFVKVAWSPDGMQLAAGTYRRGVVVFGNPDLNFSANSPEIPIHGKVFQHLSRIDAVDTFTKKVPPAPWRQPLKNLRDRLASLAEGNPVPVETLVEEWLQSGMATSEEFAAHLQAGLGLIDGLEHPEVAKRLGEELIAFLGEHQGVLGRERSLLTMLDAHHRVCHRVASSGVDLTQHQSFLNAEEAALQMIGEFPGNRLGWKFRLALETLEVQSQVDRCKEGIAGAAEDFDAKLLRQAFDQYAVVLHGMPQGILPFDVPPQPDHSVAYWKESIADLELRHGRVPTFQEVWIDALIAQVANHQDEIRPHYLLALSYLMLENQSAYRKTCQLILDRFVEANDPITARFAAWSSCLAPDAVPDYSAVLALYRRAPTENLLHHEVLGALHYRMGNFKESRQELSAIAELEHSDSSPAYGWYFLAMAEQQLGNAEEARRWKARADEYVKQQLVTLRTSPVLLWNRIASLQLLQREAQNVVPDVSE